tara:strand:+ start:128 stop:529 length:402 start_codon:yes stop_codon:yes gene_type:complete
MNNNNIKLPSNHKFGIFFTIIFFLGGLYFLYKDILILYFSFFLISLIFLLLTIIKPKKLHILNKAWMKFGFILGRFISPIILGIIFFGLFFPISIIFKLTKRDELKIIKVKNKSLWKYRKEKTNFSKQFKLQF